MVTFFHAPLQILFLNKIYTNTPVPPLRCVVRGVGGGKIFCLYLSEITIMYLLTTSQLTQSDYLWMLSAALITMSAYIGRKHKPFDSLWRFISVGLAVILTYFVVGNIADRFRGKD